MAARAALRRFRRSGSWNTGAILLQGADNRDDLRGVIDLGVSALLSAALVAFTIESDNEFEHQLATAGGAPVVLTSMVMWSNFMRLVGSGVAVEELAVQAGVTSARVHPSLAGMERWGYVSVCPDPADARARPPRRAWLVRPTAGGRRAQELWPSVLSIVEDRWIERYGTDEMHRLRAPLEAIAGQLATGLPHYLPVVTRSMFLDLPDSPSSSAPTPVDAPSLPMLLSRLLIAFTREYERDSELSLTMNANALRVLNDRGVRVRDVPRLAGVSKPAVAMSLGFLAKQGFVLVEPDPAAPRTKRARLTATGLDSCTAHDRRLAEVEAGWREQFGDDLLALRAACAELVRDQCLDRSPLARALEPYRSGWRASAPGPAVLPHHPMVLPRGGWPDGS